MKKIIYLIPLLALVITGCSTSPASLYWGNYSDTLYDVKKDGTESAYKKHEQELLSIVKESKKKGTRVPPGVYAELGVYTLEKGEKNLAREYFNLEQQVYPEGSILMQKLLEE